MDTQWQEYGPEEQKSTIIKPSQETYIPSSFFNQKEKKGVPICPIRSTRLNTVPLLHVTDAIIFCSIRGSEGK